jgi:hypothetical protein
MPRSLSRFLYRCLLRLHPRSFKAQFASEMLWIFDELADRQSVRRLFADGLLSLARQWIVRSALQKLWIGDSNLLPSTGSMHELFAWERIAIPDASLPLPRVLQGSMASFAFIASLSLLALDAGGAARPRCLSCGIDPVKAPGYVRSSSQTRASGLTVGEANSPSRAGTTEAAAESAAVAPNAPKDAEPNLRSPIPGYDPTPGKVPVSPIPTQVLTAQYDNARTGTNLNEITLAPDNVNTTHFGKLFTFKVDGDVYAQPLYLPGVDIPGKGKRNVLFVATENDSVYAFDADGSSTTPLWHVSVANSAVGAKPLSESDVRCFFIAPQIGITSTPVIDPKTGTLYVLARTKESKSLLSSYEYKQRLHALAVTTGAEKFGGPVEIKASVQGTGAGHSGRQVPFDPQTENPRAALLLANGSVYLAWGSSCDEVPYHGWLMAYDALTLTQKAVFNTSPDASDSAIWQGDAGPAADKDGNVFVVTGNGEFDAAENGRDFGDSVLKLSSAEQRLTLLDYFTPSNQRQLNERDNDLGSSGPVLLADQPGAHPHLLVAAGKEGKIYLIDRDHMGKFQPNDDSHALQTISASHGAFGAMAYWNQNIFFVGSEARLQDFSVTRGQLTLKAAGNITFLDSGATPAVSSNGLKDGIVWAASSKNWNEPPGRPAVLYAYDASNVHRELYNSEQNSARDRAGTALRFAIPTVVNGKVYVGAKGEVNVYGLLPTR